MTPVSHIDRSNAEEASEHSSERWSGASGYLVIALGIAVPRSNAAAHRSPLR